MNMNKPLSRPALQLILSAFTLLPLAVQAQAPEEQLASEKMCNACHQADAPSIGPAWQAIAARHASRREEMTPVLAVKIVEGGGGNWGNVPMVPNQRVSRDEALLLARWVLQQVPE